MVDVLSGVRVKRTFGASEKAVCQIGDPFASTGTGKIAMAAGC